MDRLPAEAKAVLSQPQTRVAVAVSGGPDSLALTALLRDWCKVHNVKLVALTVNHAIREESADEIKVLGRQLELLGVASPPPPGPATCLSTPSLSTPILHPPILPFPMSPQLPVWLAPTVRKLHPHAVVGESYTVILQPIQKFVVLRLISSWPWPLSSKGMLAVFRKDWRCALDTLEMPPLPIA